ncbi:hypothetical protein LEP1GSC132_0310, partial [Leptospira kirschneri str. 200803703]
MNFSPDNLYELPHNVDSLTKNIPLFFVSFCSFTFVQAEEPGTYRDLTKAIQNPLDVRV